MTDRSALHAAARGGDADAMVELALLLEGGITGDEEDGDPHAEVERWLGQAARAGNLRGVAELGAFLWHVRQDEQAALPWLMRAADGGDAGAMAVLGDVHDFLGDTDLARRWYGAAAALGDAGAAANLAALNRLID